MKNKSVHAKSLLHKSRLKATTVSSLNKKPSFVQTFVRVFATTMMDVLKKLKPSNQCEDWRERQTLGF